MAGRVNSKWTRKQIAASVIVPKTVPAKTRANLTMFSSNVLGALAAIFTALAALFGLLAWGKSYFEGKAKDRALEKFKTESSLAIEEQRQKTEEQRQRAAESEVKLAEIKRRQDRRLFDIEKFQSELRGKPHSDVEILCQPNDDEAYGLANILSIGLATSGWPLVQPVPIPPEMGMQPPKKMIDGGGKIVDMPARGQEIFEKLFKSQPPTVRAGAGGAAISSFSFGIFVVSNKDVAEAFSQNKLDSSTPQGALLNAFNVVGLNAGPGPANNELPDNKLRIIVAAKP